MEIEKGVVIAILLLTLAMLGGAIIALAASHNEDEVWLQFRKERHCRIVGEMTGGYKTSPKTGWLCDNGMTYWR